MAKNRIRASLKVQNQGKHNKILASHKRNIFEELLSQYWQSIKDFHVDIFIKRRKSFYFLHSKKRQSGPRLIQLLSRRQFNRENDIKFPIYNETGGFPACEINEIEEKEKVADFDVSDFKINLLRFLVNNIMK